MATVVVSGALANKPANGGAAWTRLSWALGFKRLGYQVYFLEQISPLVCVDQTGARCAVEQSSNLAHFTTVTKQFGLAAALIVEGEARSIGLDWNDLVAIAQSADLLVNISGHLTTDALKRRFRKRIFIDLDPGYTQFWHEEGLAEHQLRDHDFYYSVGENIGRPFCAIPTGRLDWRPIRQPIVLDDWPIVPIAVDPIRFTTVASWRGPLGRATYLDTTFGVKAHEFRKFVTLPRLSDCRYEIALEVDPADQCDVDALHRHGWQIVDPRDVASDPWSFRQYVQRSSAEFSVAQGIYVETQSGWFSDRTLRYLASGKPALVQDTGWSRTYPSGRGLVGFSTLQQAVDGAERIARDYGEHSRAARAIAEEFFDSKYVLRDLVNAVDGQGASLEKRADD